MVVQSAARPAAGTLRSDLHERLERVEASLEALRTAVAELPSVIRKGAGSGWSKPIEQEIGSASSFDAARPYVG